MYVKQSACQMCDLSYWNPASFSSVPCYFFALRYRWNTAGRYQKNKFCFRRIQNCQRFVVFFFFFRMQTYAFLLYTCVHPSVINTPVPNTSSTHCPIGCRHAYIYIYIDIHIHFYLYLWLPPTRISFNSNPTEHVEHAAVHRLRSRLQLVQSLFGFWRVDILLLVCYRRSQANSTIARARARN